MPNRILKEGVCVSEDIEAMGDVVEAFYYRLWTACDDFGNTDARPAVLRGRLYPLRRSMTEAAIGRRLAVLEQVGAIFFYEVEGRRYLHVPTFTKHQQVRARRGRYPEPPEAIVRSLPITSDIDRSSRARLRVSDSDSVSESDLGGVRGGYSEQFEEFWRTYPRREGKGKASEALDKALGFAPFEDILAAAARYRDDPNRDPAFTAHPTTWLNQRRWEDDPLPERPANGKPAPADWAAIQREMRELEAR